MLADTSMERLEKMVAVSGIAPDSSRLQRDANLSQLHSLGPSAWFRATVFPLQGGCSAIESYGGWMKMVACPGAAPGASSFQTRRVC